MTVRVTLLATLAALITGASSDAQEYPHAFPRPGVTQLLENERVLIWEATWPSSVDQVYHRHRYDMTGVFLRWGPLRVTRLDGTYTESLDPFEVPRVFFQAKGVTHKEEGIGEPLRHAIMIDLKEHHPPLAERPPGVRPAFPMDGAEELIDNERVTVRSLELGTGGTVPAHHHERDAVWVFVERAGTLRVEAEDGSSTTVEGEPGTVRFVPRGTVHSLDVASGSPWIMIYEVQ